MFIIKGKLLHLFVGTDFTKEDGTFVPGKPKIQVVVISHLKNGQIKNELLDISIPQEKVALYKDKVNSTVEVEVGVIGKCNYYGI